MPSLCLCQNLISIWQFARDAICRGNSLGFELASRSPSVTNWALCQASEILHQQNVNWFRSNTQSSQTLWETSPVLLSTSRCSQTPLELSKVLSDSARAFWGDSESTCSYGAAFRMCQDSTHRCHRVDYFVDLPYLPAGCDEQYFFTALNIVSCVDGGVGWDVGCC